MPENHEVLFQGVQIYGIITDPFELQSPDIEPSVRNFPGLAGTAMIAHRQKSRTLQFEMYVLGQESTCFTSRMRYYQLNHTMDELWIEKHGTLQITFPDLTQSQWDNIVCEAWTMRAHPKIQGCDQLCYYAPYLFTFRQLLYGTPQT